MKIRARVIILAKVIVFMIVWHWYKNRNINQQNKIESPEINPHIYGHFSFDKGGKNIQWRRQPLPKVVQGN